MRTPKEQDIHKNIEYLMEKEQRTSKEHKYELE
jgi:hypothetical protein